MDESSWTALVSLIDPPLTTDKKSSLFDGDVLNWNSASPLVVAKQDWGGGLQKQSKASSCQDFSLLLQLKRGAHEKL